ncbi:hypothetical protein EMCG_07822 [[Emmonsia] crescens]|uniref:Uncharacterized protein n=1 Tax=[Emmonsia] crescens TaxID=73230 RepID=A0A0G2JAW3_9EURO|nr:hypothetical protein EMCG_07822 [Emmonsia crescens UAMH 3008]
MPLPHGKVNLRLKWQLVNGSYAGMRDFLRKMTRWHIPMQNGLLRVDWEPQNSLSATSTRLEYTFPSTSKKHGSGMQRPQPVATRMPAPGSTVYRDPRLYRERTTSVLPSHVSNRSMLLMDGLNALQNPRACNLFNKIH